MVSRGTRRRRWEGQQEGYSEEGYSEEGSAGVPYSEELYDQQGYSSELYGRQGYSSEELYGQEGIVWSLFGGVLFGGGGGNCMVNSTRS